MAKGYWIVQVDVQDEEPVKRYSAGNHPIFEKFGGRYLVRSQKFEIPEGSSRSRQVVVEFPDYASAPRVLSLARVSNQQEDQRRAFGRFCHRGGLRWPATIVALA